MTKKQKIVRCLRSDKGETLVELLFSLLITSLAMVILATMIVASTKVIERGEAVIKEYAQAENDIVKQEGSGAPGEVTFKANGTEQKLSDYDSDTKKINVSYYVNDKLGRNKVITYK